MVDERSGTHNEVEGGVHGPVAQAGVVFGGITVGVGAGRPVLVPRQLPAVSRRFVGRATEQARLTTALDDAVGTGDAVPVLLLTGLGGMGKTTLAVRWARHNLDRFPDGQLYANLRGFDVSKSPVPSTVVLRGFLTALGVGADAIPVGEDARSALFRSLVSDKRLLVVLDNAHDADQVAPLLPGGPGCVALVTSRNTLSGLIVGHGAHRLRLDVLSRSDSRDLLGAWIGEHRMAAEREAAEELVDHCAGLPLALSIVGARARSYPDFSLAAVADGLRHAAARLASLDDDTRSSLPVALSWSYEALTPKQAELFRLLGVAPTPDIGVATIASLVGAGPDRVGPLLAALERTSLVHRHRPDRYRMHDLVHLYAAQLPWPDRQASHSAWARMVGFQVRTACAAERVLAPHRAPAELDLPTEGGPTPVFTDSDEALAWFDSEHAALLATQRVSAQRADHRAVWLIGWALTNFHWRRGHLHDQLATLAAGSAAA
ncbi:MAG: AAA family ATPase, partial [Saccharothrix sp.]|nr:AAA family ATPase [Saccharothrix sp.]